MTESNAGGGRSYGCTFGCGNPYDFVLIDVGSSTTEFLCLPDLVRLAGDLVAAMTEANNPALAEALALAQNEPQEPAPGPRGRPRGKNSPVGTPEPDIFSDFDAIEVAELADMDCD